MKIELLPGETVIDTYILFYTLPGEKKFNGRLTVTNQRPIHPLLWDENIISIICKEDISYVEMQKSLLSNKIIITLTDRSKHEFNRVAMSVCMLADIINS